MCQNCFIKTCYEKVIFQCLYISVLHLSNISFRTVQFFARSKRMKVENIYICILDIHKSEFEHRTPLSKVCTYAEEISWSTFSMTRICQFLNTCTWKQPQSMLNVSKPWWGEEISWLSHVVAYYPSNQPAYALHSHLPRRIYATPHLCHLVQNTSHPLKDINIIVGRHVSEI